MVCLQRNKVAKDTLYFESTHSQRSLGPPLSAALGLSPSPPEGPASQRCVLDILQAFIKANSGPPLQIHHLLCCQTQITVIAHRRHPSIPTKQLGQAPWGQPHAAGSGTSSSHGSAALYRRQSRTQAALSTPAGSASAVTPAVLAALAHRPYLRPSPRTSTPCTATTVSRWQPVQHWHHLTSKGEGTSHGSAMTPLPYAGCLLSVQTAPLLSQQGNMNPTTW